MTSAWDADDTGSGFDLGAAIDPAVLDRQIIDAVARRIHQKMDDYEAYNFTAKQSIALNVFFDLAQEFSQLEHLYAVCLLIPKMFFDIECNLYVLDSKSGAIRRCAYRCMDVDAGEIGDLPFPQKTIVRDDRLYIPIKGNHELISQLPFTPREDVFGMLEIYPASHLSEHDRLFFERYANRFGFQLHNRILANKNKEHLQFIRSLVKDIGHNVIVPNIYFKLYYKRLRSKIDLLKFFEWKLKQFFETDSPPGEVLPPAKDKLLRDLGYVHEGLMDQYRQILTHYEQTSLFLETLLRRSHFEEGRYVLEKRACNFKKQVIDLQMERYRPRFEERGIEVDTSLGGVPDQEIEVVVDIGLISQVYANLFSNAVKYTREVVDTATGQRRRFISFGWERKENFFGPGRDGIKLNVFTSGPPIPPETAAHLFEEGVRGENASGEYGTGHGLYFIREVVRLHGGVEGYEAT
ncbi:MAG: sensor histidine kinase, partial [Acidobacteriota bacterium]